MSTWKIQGFKTVQRRLEVSFRYKLVGGQELSVSSKRVEIRVQKGNDPSLFCHQSSVF